MIKELPTELKLNNLTEKESKEYFESVSRVFHENFLVKVLKHEMTMEQATVESVKLWDKKVNDMCNQLLTEYVNKYGQRKIDAFADASLDLVYKTFRDEASLI